MSLANIKTVILVMFENRSFDHMLGHLSLQGIQPDADGLVNPLSQYANVYQGDPYPPFPMPGDTQLDFDVPHEYPYVAAQLHRSPVNGQLLMDGFVEAYADYDKVVPNPQPDPMGYFTADQVPVTSFLAQKFAPCDRWFCPLPTSTQPNRTVAFCGKSAIYKTGLQIIPDTDNIFDWLDRQPVPVSWRVYHDGFSFFALYPGLWGKVLGDNFRDYEELFRDMQEGTDVPQVIIVEPSYEDAPHIGPDHPNDNHAPLAIGWGEDFLRRTYQAATVNPELWKQTLMVVYYDEHGGFYDHVAPPAFNNARDNASPPDAPPFSTLGPRIPGILVSPWVDPGKVIHDRYDHTSVLQLLGELFNPDKAYSDAVTYRSENGIASISSALTDTPSSIPAPPAPSGAINVKSALGDNIPTPPVSPMGQAFEQAAVDMMSQQPEGVKDKYPELYQWKAAVDQARST
ncbi:alkaline phosphatase family protein [Mucilaginibacter sp. McL0603]|uniref:alkaline phosphatase family protein n=1 Tax=Mucilaginibacter sp. McL0603 TaxID=3415670 RepID=UPI003CFA40E2